MGREARILLAMLGLLVGVFVGVLSMKLLVPRPPAGAGADINEIAAVMPADIVEPPAMSPPADPPREATDRYAASSQFATAAGGPDADATAADDSAPQRDPFVARTAFEEPPPLAEQAAREARPIAVVETPVGESQDAVARPPAAVAAPSVVAAGFAAAPVGLSPARESYVAAVGDSWWSLAERTYGDGRLYRALFAWNRTINPRVSLVPGTTLELPSRSRLAAAWPALVPGE